MVQLLRSEVDELETWDLTDIFSCEEEWEKEYALLNATIEEELIQTDTIKDGTQLFLLLEKMDELLVRLEKTAAYARYKLCEDSTNPHNQMISGRAQQLNNKKMNVYTKFVNAISALSEEYLLMYFAEEPRLYTFQRFISRINEARKGALSAEVENVLSALNGAIQSPTTLYNTITSADLKFKPAKNRHGEEIPISLFSYLTQIETSPDTILRRNAYESLTNGLKEYQHGIAQTMATEIYKNVTLAKLRGYPSTLDMLLQYVSPTNFFMDSDGVSSEYFEMVLDTIQTNLAPHMQRYARLRKKVLGLDCLLFSDVKAPLDPDFDPPISFEEAGDILIEAVGVLGPEYQEFMRQAVKERWVYRANNEGRNMIAFGGGIQGVHGYSFYPWFGNLFDMFLLGHELGHAIHYTFGQGNQRILNNAGSKIFVETPSTLVEHLLVQYVRKNNSDNPRYMRWLNMYLMMSYQHNFVTHILEAELLRRLYKMAEAKVPLTTATISQTKLDILTGFWGDTVEMDEGAKLTWMRQPHYYMGLYPYTYSVGLSASTVLAKRMEKEGLSAGMEFVEVLKQGGNKKGLDLFNMLGLEMKDPSIYKEAVDFVGKIVDELEKSF
ncbi:M3 family metallopeptidase [Pseudoneobacillus sp. C159]